MTHRVLGVVPGDIIIIIIIIKGHSLLRACLQPVTIIRYMYMYIDSIGTYIESTGGSMHLGWGVLFEK